MQSRTGEFGVSVFNQENAILTKPARVEILLFIIDFTIVFWYNIVVKIAFHKTILQASKNFLGECICMATNKERARALLEKMTLNEKVGQLAQLVYGFKAYDRDENGEIFLTEDFKAYVQKFGGLGMLNNYFRSDPWSQRCYATGGIVLEEREKAYNLLQKYIVENTRLGIPVLVEEDTPHGRQVLDSVLYPVSFNVGCTFNPKLYRRQTEAIGIESRLGGCHVPYLSNLDMAVDPRWGRSEECFSEDPYLASKLSQAAVEGMNDAGSMVCCKHFAAQGAALGGHNGGIAMIGERELREIHLPSTESAVKAGCDFIMAAYNEIDGVLCHANSYLLKDILRGEMGYEGVVRSDGCANDSLVDMGDGSMANTAAIALQAGVDCGLWDRAYTHIEEAVKQGYISESVVDDAVCRLLEKKFKCGVMDNPYLEENNQSVKFIESGHGQQVAYEVAAESLVLLKNEKATLPLSEDKKVLIVGENLSNIYYALGDYTSERKPDTLTLKDVFTKNGAKYLEGWNFNNGITVSDAELEKAVKAADVVIFGFGGSSMRDFESDYNDAGAINNAANYMDCGEGRDLASLIPMECQRELLKKIAALGKPVISLGIGGRAYVLGEITDNSDALIWCGYPGQEGARAIYDTVYGKQNRFGRLSVSFPKHVGQLPINYNYKRTYDYVDIDSKPLFPFGYGLSYSNFEYSDFEVKSATLEEIRNGGSIEVNFTVKNVSSVTGMPVPQLYVARKGGTITHRNREQKGFDKFTLEPNESKRVSFTLGYDELKEWSMNKKYELLGQRIKIMVGTSCQDIVFESLVTI